MNKHKIQTKTIEEQGLKQVETLEVLQPEEDKEQKKITQRTNEIKKK